MEYEIWKAVVGYEGSYEVSNHGRVRSLDRVAIRFYKSTGKERPYPIVGKVLKMPTNDEGYRSVCLSGRERKVHRLVADAFLGERPLRYEIDHINNDRTDNRIMNLEYVSSRENTLRGKMSRLKNRVVDLPRGVYQRESGSYYTKTTIGGKRVFLGTYKTVDEASAVYEKAIS